MRRTARRSTGPDVARPTPEPGPGRTHQSLYSMRSLRRKSRLAGASHGAVRPQLCDPDRNPCWPGRRGHPCPGRPAARHRQRPDAGDCRCDSTGCASIPPSAIQNNCPNCRGVGDRLRSRPRFARRMAGGVEDGLCLRPRCEFLGLVWVHRHAHRDSSERPIGRGIPEDDPRNPAVIADLVGDNVGDCAGRGADLFESTAAENIGAMVLGVALFAYFGIAGIIFPLVARGFGVIASIVGVYVVRAREEESPMAALNRGYLVTTIIAASLFAIAAWAMLQPPAASGADAWTWLRFWLCGLAGMITAFLYVWITQYYTEARYRPVREIAKSSETGPATNIISGFSVGLEATWLPALVVSGALLISYWLGQSTGITTTIPGSGGLYGTAIATMGMLSTAAYILAMDTFGPIVDNGAGIIEMSGMSEDARRNMDKLDAAGNTTKALTKGYAVGSAGLAAFLLFNAFLTEANLKSVDLAHPETFVGGFIGAALVFLFTAYAIRAVGRAAWAIIKDVRDQFHEDPGIMAGTSKPDYARSVDIVTRSALKEMIVPGLLAVATPVAVGVFFRFVRVTPGLLAGEPLGGTLMVGTIAGVLMALVLNTGGGAWDNAKKFIEAGNLGGKGSPTHKAAVVGDTVGDPFKDTAGPSLHILVKLLSTITLVIAPLLIY